MKKEERVRKQKEGLKLYLQGVAKHQIAKRLNIGEKTVYLWEKAKGWKEKFEEHSRRLTENIQDDVFEEKRRSLQLIRGAESIIAKKIQSGEIEGVTIASLSQLERAKWEILLPRSLTQYNFMKQENLNVTIQDEIERFKKVVWEVKLGGKKAKEEEVKEETE